MYTVAFWFLGLLVAVVIVTVLEIKEPIVGVMLGFGFSMAGVLVGAGLDANNARS